MATRQQVGEGDGDPPLVEGDAPARRGLDGDVAEHAVSGDDRDRGPLGQLEAVTVQFDRVGTTLPVRVSNGRSAAPAPGEKRAERRPSSSNDAVAHRGPRVVHRGVGGHHGHDVLEAMSSGGLRHPSRRVR